MKFKILSFAVAFCFQVFAFAGPLVVGNAAGSEENHYVSLWANRAELFQQCLQVNIDCNMSEAEQSNLKKMSLMAVQWKPFQFFDQNEFAERAIGFIQPANLSFVAYAKSSHAVIFNYSLLYTELNKFSFDKKLTLLATIAADQAGLSSGEAKPVIEKLVSFWQKRWSKLDLRMLDEPTLQIWIQQGQNLAILLFDDLGIFDLAALLTSQVQCKGGTPSNLKVSAPYWSSHTKATDTLNATLAGSISYECGAEDVAVLRFEIDLVFQKSLEGWKNLSDGTKVHLSSLE